MTENSKVFTEEEENIVFMMNLHACSAIARNVRAYNALKSDLADKEKTEAYYTALKHARNFFDCKFFRSRPLALCLRTMEVFAYFASVGDTQKYFMDFLSKHFRSIYEDVYRRKGMFPENVDYFARHTSSLDEILERFSVYELVAGVAIAQHPEFTEARAQEASKEISMLLRGMPALFAKDKPKSGAISKSEKVLRSVLSGEENGRTLASFFEEDDRHMLFAVSDKFCLRDIPNYQFTGKDWNGLARCIVQGFKDSTLYKMLMEENNQQPFASPVSEDEYNAFRLTSEMLDKEIASVNLNYARLLYATSKASEDDRNDIADMLIASYREKQDDKAESKESRSARIIAEKDRLLEKRQSELNRMQMSLDKANRKFDELKERYVDAKNALEETQRLLEGIQEGKVKVSDVERDVPAVFPENTLLFGGHPNWLRKFRLKYPGVKVYDADDMSFTTDVIRNAELILINVTHMSHKQYAPVIKAIRQYHKHVEYIK